MSEYRLIGAVDAWRLRPGLNRVGRHPDNDLRIPHPSASSHHCEIEVHPDRLIIRDLGSTNGTFVEGVRIQLAELAPGQRLLVGELELRIEREEGRIERADEIQISVPVLTKKIVPGRSILQDGSPACLHHPGVAADWQCTRCAELFCRECVRTLGLSGGKKRVFCPACSGECEASGWASATTTRRHVWVEKIRKEVVRTWKFWFKRGK